jgi:hypothetical protein
VAHRSVRLRFACITPLRPAPFPLPTSVTLHRNATVIRAEISAAPACSPQLPSHRGNSTLDKSVVTL